MEMYIYPGIEEAYVEKKKLTFYREIKREGF